MIAFDTHICLVSEQPLPNLAAALDPAIGAPNVVLIETPSMASRNKGEHLARVLDRHGKRVYRELLPNDPDLVGFQHAFNAVVARHPKAALNATGGTKPMALIAFDVMRSRQRPVFYVEPDNSLIWLAPADEPAGRVRGGLELHDYFAAFGQTIEAYQVNPDPDDGYVPGKVISVPPSRPEHPQAGRMFESQVFRCAREALKASAPRDHFEIAWGLVTAEPQRDELDIVAVRDNVLFIIECKHTVKTDLNAFLNKLDNLRSKRGLTARAALVTTSMIARHGGNMQRAKANHILLVGGHELPTLRSRLQAWFSGKSL